MSCQQRALREIKAIGLLTFYFAAWFEMIPINKQQIINKTSTRKPM